MNGQQITSYMERATKRAFFLIFTGFGISKNVGKSYEKGVEI